MIVETFANIWGLLPFGAREVTGGIPEGYRDAGKSVDEFSSPTLFDGSPFEIYCGECDEKFRTYWYWFNHADVRGFENVREAMEQSTVIVPEGFDGGPEATA